MPQTEQTSVDLPADVAATMRAHVVAGRFASESEAVTVAPRAIDDREDGLEAWLRRPVAEAYDEIEAGTATFYTSDEVRARLRILR